MELKEMCVIVRSLIRFWVEITIEPFFVALGLSFKFNKLAVSQYSFSYIYTIIFLSVRLDQR